MTNQQISTLDSIVIKPIRTEEEYHNLIDKLQSMINNESTTD